MQSGLTDAVFQETADVIYQDLRAQPNFHTPGRVFDFSRVYRILIRSQTVTQQSIYEDAIFITSHNESGLARRGAAPNNTIPVSDNTEGRTNKEFTFLVYVGREDILDQLIKWWILLLKARKMVRSACVVEQDAAVALDQVSAVKGTTPVMVSTQLQLASVDLWIQQVKRTSGREIWTLL